MAFTDSILTGEQLNRAGIRSANYIPGEAGWRVASNGGAEFDNLSVRGNVAASNITLDGRDLGTRLDSMPRGIQAWMSGYPTVATTSGAKILETEVEVEEGRWYEISLINITPDISNVKQCEFHIKYTTNETTPGVGSSPMAISLRVSQFEMANVRAMWTANYTGRLRLAGTIHSLDGATVRCWAPGTGCVLAVYDHGVTPPMVGSIGTGTVTKTLKQWTIYANETKTYLGNGNQRTDQYGSSMVAGDWANGLGNQRAWCTFNSSDNALLDDMIGVPLADIDTVNLRLTPYQWAGAAGGGNLSIGAHNATNLYGSQELGGGVPNIFRPYVVAMYPVWINLMDPDASSIISGIRDGYVNGFMIGNTYSGASYRVVCEGVGWTNPPALQVQYWK